MKCPGKQTLSRATPWAILFLSTWLGVFQTAAQTTNRSAQERATLDRVLGSNFLGWKFSQPGRIETLDWHAVLCSGGQALTLSGSELFPTDVEYRLVLRLMPTQGVANAKPDGIRHRWE